MKKILSVLLAVLLLASAAGSAFAVTEADADIWTAELSGFTMRIPEAYRDAKGLITFSDAGEGVNPGSGIVLSAATYVAMSVEEYRALKEEELRAYESGDITALYEVSEKISPVEWSLFYVYGINRGRGEDELRRFLIEQNVNPDYYNGDEKLMAAVTAMYENMTFREIGEKDGLRYYLCSFNPENLISLLDANSFDPSYLSEFRSLARDNDRLADNVTLTGGAELADAAETGSRLVFETTDLEGNPVTSEEIFSGHAITMINMWATWCDPCKRELPALAEMAEKYEEKGCRIIGLCLDAEDEETMAEARAILKEAGVSYLNIVPFEGRSELLPNTVYPTTYFVDENGVILDETVNGAQLSRYPAVIEKLLSQQVPETAGEGKILDGRWLNSNLEGNVTEDTPAELKDDFYLHVNKDWFLETQIPEGKGVAGNSADIDRRVKDWQISLATDESLTGHDAELVRKLYALTDWDYRNAQGIEPILPSVVAIADIDSREELLHYLCSEKNLTHDVPFIVNVWEDVLDASVYTAVIDPMNLILVSPEEYDERTEVGEEEYAMLQKETRYLLARFGYSEEEAQAILDRAIEADALFASHMLSRADKNADEEDVGHYYEPEQLTALAGDFPIMDILAVRGMEGGKRYNISEPDFIAGLQEVFTEENVPLIRDWLLVRLVPNVISLLDQDAARFSAAIAMEQYGFSAESNDADDAIALVAELLPVPLDNLYIQATCSEEKRAEIQEIVDEILVSYRSMLEKEDWLSEETREKAIEKLDNMHSNVLYPDQLGDWSALDFAGPEEGGSLLGANFKILEFRDYLKAARMDTAVDRNEWDQILSPADTVNCNYTSQNNTMNIMAAFADGEFYRDGMSYEQMLGGIGFVIAHEISHAFDTQGAKYDKDGSLSDWWTAEDYAAFQKRADRLAEWFDGFIPVEGVNYDGMGVRREVIADMAAMKCLLTLAAQKENFDYDAFFRQIAISQREVGTPESINYMIKFDTHPLPYMRANGTLAQYDDFLNFYGIQEGDGMYIAPEDRVAVW